jgi:hypothetical protein
MRSSAWLPLCGLGLLLVSCQMAHETPAQHAVHKGESATLSPHLDGPVWIAADREAAHALNKAYESKDEAGLKKLAEAGKALQVERGASVKVIGETFNEREVKLIDTALAGKTGWVPYEWLQPAAAGEP